MGVLNTRLDRTYCVLVTGLRIGVASMLDYLSLNRNEQHCNVPDLQDVL